MHWADFDLAWGVGFCYTLPHFSQGRVIARWRGAVGGVFFALSKSLKIRTKEVGP